MTIGDVFHPGHWYATQTVTKVMATRSAREYAARTGKDQTVHLHDPSDECDQTCMKIAGRK